MLSWIKEHKGTAELAPYNGLSPTERKLYFDCMTIAGLPIDLDTVLNIPDVSPKPMIALQFLQQLSLYVRRSDATDKRFQLVFPQMVLLYHAYEPYRDPRDKAWQVFSGNRFTMLPPDGSSLELALRLCISRTLKLYVLPFKIYSSSFLHTFSPFVNSFLGLGC